MRWKLLFIASLLAAVVGAGGPLLTALFLSGPNAMLKIPGLFVVGSLIVPLAATTYASIFVYRHTARRRSLQAILAALISIVLTLTVIIAGSAFLGKQLPAPTPPVPLRNVG